MNFFEYTQCNGKRLNGLLYTNKNEFKLESLLAGKIRTAPAPVRLNLRLSLSDMKELRDDLDAIISKMEASETQEAASE